MALANFSLSYDAPAPFALTTDAPVQLQLDDLLYTPEEHQSGSEPHKNDPYSPPAQRRSKLRKRAGTPYLPPPNQFTQYTRENTQYSQQSLYNNPRLSVEVENQNVREVNAAYEGAGGYVHDPSGDYDGGFPQRRLDHIPRNPPAPAPDYRQGNYFDNPYRPTPSTPRFDTKTSYYPSVPQRPAPNLPPVQHNQLPNAPQHNQLPNVPQHNQLPNVPQHNQLPNVQQHNQLPNLPQHNQIPDLPQHNQLPELPQHNQLPELPQHNQLPSVPQHNQLPSVPQEPAPLNGFVPVQSGPGAGGQAAEPRPPGFTRVDGGGGTNTKTQLHAVLDYDDDYYDDVPGAGGAAVGAGAGQQVTPLQGPILLRNGSVPVVPLYSYPTVNNGSFYQIPILWTALSLALGYELQGQVIRGVPCVKRNFQLYCPTAGSTYPLEKIETFIDENKALMKRMYGAFGGAGGGAASGGGARPDPHPHAGDTYFGRVREEGGKGGRSARQAGRTPPPLTPAQGNSTNRVDACESKTEIVTPYWALNSARKLRAVVNTMHFEQAIHQEVCSKTSTSRCAGDCGCEQKYKWHRLLAYDPEEDCSGIFMDWFLFPSCCVCRCNP